MRQTTGARETGPSAPFKRGDRVTVPGRYLGLVVTSCWQGRDILTERVDGMTVKTALPGDWRVRADFESGFGHYEGLASEFRRTGGECHCADGGPGSYDGPQRDCPVHGEQSLP